VDLYLKLKMVIIIYKMQSILNTTNNNAMVDGIKLSKISNKKLVHDYTYVKKDIYLNRFTRIELNSRNERNRINLENGINRLDRMRDLANTLMSWGESDFDEFSKHVLNEYNEEIKYKHTYELCENLLYNALNIINKKRFFKRIEFFPNSIWYPFWKSVSRYFIYKQWLNYIEMIYKNNWDFIKNAKLFNLPKKLTQYLNSCDCKTTDLINHLGSNNVTLYDILSVLQCELHYLINDLSYEFCINVMLRHKLEITEHDKPQLEHKHNDILYLKRFICEEFPQLKTYLDLPYEYIESKIDVIVSREKYHPSIFNMKMLSILNTTNDNEIINDIKIMDISVDSLKTKYDVIYNETFNKYVEIELNGREKRNSENLLNGINMEERLNYLIYNMNNWNVDDLDEFTKHILNTSNFDDVPCVGSYHDACTSTIIESLKMINKQELFEKIEELKNSIWYSLWKTIEIAYIYYNWLSYIDDFEYNTYQNYRISNVPDTFRVSDTFKNYLLKLDINNESFNENLNNNSVDFKSLIHIIRNEYLKLYSTLFADIILNIMLKHNPIIHEYNSDKIKLMHDTNINIRQCLFNIYPNIDKFFTHCYLFDNEEEYHFDATNTYIVEDN
jgi:hypothetical protein